MDEKFFVKKIIRIEFGKSILSAIFIVRDKSLFDYGNKSIASDVINHSPYGDEPMKWMTTTMISTRKYDKNNYNELTHIDENYIETDSYVSIDDLKEVPKDIMEEFKSKLKDKNIIGVGFKRGKTKSGLVSYHKYKFSLNKFGECDLFDFYD